MRRGTYDNHWDTGPENWVNHNPRFTRGIRRANFHGFNTRTPNPRHWRPEGGFRPRGPTWSGPQQFVPHGVRPPLRPPSGPGPAPNLYLWLPGQSSGLLQTPPLPEYQHEKEKPTPNQSFGLPCDNIHETINTIKQKLRDRKVSETNVDFAGDSSAEYPDDNISTKASERRRIEHAKLPRKPLSAKKSEIKDLNTAKGTKLATSQHSPTNIYQRKSELMRRKILKQLFKLDKETLRKILTQPISSTKYDFALNSLIKETRTSISRQLRNIAEKSLRLHETNADSLQGKQIVQDAFMGHLGTMLDTDASVELSNMEPQVIAELSKVLQEDLMSTLNEEMSVRSLASAMQDPVTEDIFPNAPNFSNYLNDDKCREGSFQNNSYPYNNHGNSHVLSGSNENMNYDETNVNCTYFDGAAPTSSYDNTHYQTNWDQNVAEYKFDPASYYSKTNNINFASNDFYNNESKHKIPNDTYRNEEFINPEFFSITPVDDLKLKTYSRKKQESDTKTQLVCPGGPENVIKTGTVISGNDKWHSNSQDSSLDKNIDDSNKISKNISSCVPPQNQVYNIDLKRISQEPVDRKSPDIKNLPRHSQSQTPSRSTNVALNNNCDNLNNKPNQLDSSKKSDTCSPPLITASESEKHSNFSENSINLRLKETALKLRKRKMSESDDNQCSKKTDLSEYNNISVRKDIFPIPNQECTSSEKKQSDLPIFCDVQNTSVGKNVSPPISVSTASQTESHKVSNKSQGSQYCFKNCDASSQVYASLISSKSKGTQCVKQNSRDRSCQTLKLDGLFDSNSSVPHNNETSIHRETQTDEPLKSETIIESNEKESLKTTRMSKTADKPKINDSHNSKSEDVLERMRQIDNDIYVLMQEKLKLYSRLDMPSSVETNSSIDTNTKNKHQLDKLRFHKYKTDMKKPPSKPYDKLGIKTFSIETMKIPKLRPSREKLPTVENQLTHKKGASHTDHQKTKESNSKHKHDSENRSRNSSLSVSKSKSRPEPVKCDRTKHVTKKDVSEIENSTCSLSNIIPGKDINNGKVDALKGKLELGCNSERPMEYTCVDVHTDSKYIDSAGCPVTPDCNLVVSEEVVIKSESDVSDQPSSADGASVKHRKRSDTSKKDKTLKSGNNSAKLDKSTCDKVALKSSIAKLPPTIPVIKIRKRRTTSGSSQSRTKSSPLFNLISQLNDTDEECDFEISNSQKDIKSSQASIESVVLENHSNHTSDKVLTADGSSNENLKYDLVDCRVYLERLDADQIVSGIADTKLPLLLDSSKVSTSSILHENYDSSIINDETLFNTKGYTNDDDCISLEQLDAVQFDDFCDPDVPNIIGNIEVNDSFSIIDQWDSKLFENVSLLEDRDMFSDKHLLDSIESDMSAQVKNNLIPTENESASSEAIHFTSHTDSIIALKCVGDNFLAASLDGNVYYYCGVKKKVLKTINVSKLAVTCLAIKPNRTPSQVYTGSHDSFLRCFNFKTGEKMLEDIDVGGPIQSMFQEWKTLYIGTQSGFVVQFDIEKGSLVPEKTMKFSDNAILALHAIKEGPRKVLLIASRSQEVTVKDASTGLLLRSFHGPNNTVYSLLHDSGKVYCGTSGPDVQVFDFVTGDLVRLHRGGRGAVCLQMYKGLLFSGCYDGMIYVFQRSDSENPVARIPGPGKMLLAMAIVNDKIIAGCKDKSLSIWPLPKEVTNLLES